MIKQLIELFKNSPEQGKEPVNTQLAAAALLVEVMAADDQWLKAEESTVQRLLVSTLQLSHEQAQSLIDEAKQHHKDAHDLYELTQQINNHYSAQEKYELIFGLWQVAYADGELDRYEDYTVRKISELLHVPHSDFIRAKLTAKPE